MSDAGPPEAKDYQPIASQTHLPDGCVMTKKRTAAALWFLMGWMLGGMGSAFLGFPGWTGLGCASVMAAIVLGDPFGIFGPKVELTVALRRVSNAADVTPGIFLWK